MARSLRVDVGAMLRDIEAAPPYAVVDVVADHLARTLGTSAVHLLLPDWSHQRLERIGGDGGHVAIDDTPAGTAYRSQSPKTDGPTVLVPVSNRGDAIGVLEVVLPAEPPQDVATELESVADAVALAVVVNARHTDAFEWRRRNRRVALAAEIQRRLLPEAYTCEGRDFTFAGWLEPAYEAGGDTFDYAVDHDRFQMMISDAMGHGVNAAQLATVLVGAIRNVRRDGGDLAAQAGAGNESLAERSTIEQSVTGQLWSLDLHSGKAAVVNAGHPVPWILHAGGPVTRPDVPPDPPFGLFLDASYTVHDVTLDPGDRVVLVSDGVIERNTLTEDEIDALLRRTREWHPRDVVRAASRIVLERTEDALADDATIVCFDWHGPR